MASWTTPVLHVTSDVLAVGDWNGLANDATFLYQAPYSRYYNSVATSLTASTVIQVTLGGTSFSGYSFSISSNNVVVPLTGIYLSIGQIDYVVTASNFFTTIYQNGSSIATTGLQPNGQEVATPCTTIVKASASDTVALYGYQNSAGAINTQTGATKTYLGLFFVGSQ